MEATGVIASSIHSDEIPRVLNNVRGDKGDVNKSTDPQQTPFAVNANATTGGSHGAPKKMNGKQSYASLFKDNRAPIEASLLKYIEPPLGEVIIGSEDIESVEKTFGFCLVGYVMGPRPSAYSMINFVKRWNGNVKFVFKDNGWILFQFASEIQRDSILNGGPYLISGRQLFLKMMPSCFLFSKEDMEHLPSWVQIYGLPADCWTTTALSRIASVVGKPIHTDQLTISKKGSTYARVLVEIDAKKSRVWDCSIKLPTGKVIIVNFKYELDPKFCNKCKSLGHIDVMCGIAPRKFGNTLQKKQQNTNINTALNSGKKPADATLQDMATKQNDIPESSNSNTNHPPVATGCEQQNTNTAIFENLQNTNATINEINFGGQTLKQDTSAGNTSEINPGNDTTCVIQSHGEHNLKKQSSTGLDLERNLGQEATATYPDIEQMSNDDLWDDEFLSFGDVKYPYNQENDFFVDDDESDDILSRVQIQDSEEWKTVSKKNRRVKNKMKKESNISNAGGGSSSMDTEYMALDPSTFQPMKGGHPRVFGKNITEARRPDTAFGGT